MLEMIHSPSDVKRLNTAQTRQLCDELRTFLVQHVAESGGHLASNLGVVELTVAIHRVFDTSRDRLVFDVGHQCYVHKILTGRRERFDTLRQFGGISGFPKPYESIHDAFVAGHASNSVSVALGMARARTMQHQDYDVLALIGAGALGGGLSFEGLNNAGASGEPMIVILNDNGMSIAPNVGAVSSHLSRLRTRPGYYAFKKRYRQLLGGGAVGEKLYHVSHDIKTALKKTLLPGSSMFESMGFTYMGPVDGHDVEALTQSLQWAREQRCSVLLHVRTVKGKGYLPAERKPAAYHGVSPFDPATGKLLRPSTVDFSHVFGEELTKLAGEDTRVCAITAAMQEGTGLTAFSQEYPQRLFDVGIAEGHAVSMAGGMAKQGLIPVFAVYSSFLQRGYDMLIQDVALDNLHVVLAVDRAGLVGADGETHHGCFDALYLSQIPHMTVLCPGSFAELRYMLRRAVLELRGPVAVRYPRGSEGVYRGCCGSETFTQLRQGSDCTILTYGILVNQALAAAELLHREGIEARVVKLNAIAPLHDDEVLAALRHETRLLVLEDCVGSGCVGQRLTAILARQGCAPEKLILKNLGDTIPCHGSVAQLYARYGLDAQSVAATLKEACHEQ